MHTILEKHNLLLVIDYLKNLRIDVLFPLNDFFKYSFPTFCWLFSYNTLIIVIWKNDFIKIISFSVFLFLPTILIEIFQYFKIDDGVFDFNDVFCILFGSLLPYIIWHEK